MSRRPARASTQSAARARFRVDWRLHCSRRTSLEGESSMSWKKRAVGIVLAGGTLGVAACSTSHEIGGCGNANPDPCICGRPETSAAAAEECRVYTECQEAGGQYSSGGRYEADGAVEPPTCVIDGGSDGGGDEVIDLGSDGASNGDAGRDAGQDAGDAGQDARDPTHDASDAGQDKS
jgi:hypothetical protein